MHQADGDLSKAAASLFILALCDKVELEAHKSHVAGFITTELLSLITDGQSADKLVRFRAVWIVETFATFLEKESLKKVLNFYGKILTTSENQDEAIKAAAMMAIFRYLSEVDSEGEEMLTAEVIKDMIGLDVVQVLKLFLEYMRKYPELLEFPNGI